MKYWKLPLFLVTLLAAVAFGFWDSREVLDPRTAIVTLDHVKIDHDPVLFLDTTHFYVRWTLGSTPWEMNETVPTKLCSNPRVGDEEEVQYITHHRIHDAGLLDYYTTLGAIVFCKPHAGQ